jgi:hypothetical protein
VCQTELVSERRIPLASPEEWQRALAGIPHTFGHTWGSCHAFSLTSGRRTFLYEARQGELRVVCPLDERPANGRCDIATPYGFSGFVGNGAWPSFPDRWHQFVRSRGYVCGYVGLSPLFDDRSHVRPRDVHQANDVYVLDLSAGLDRLWRNLHVNRKRQLRQWRPEHDRDPDQLIEFFLRTYPAAMERRNASPYYRFSEATLASVCQLENVFLLGAGNGRLLEAVSVFGYTPYAADFLFNAPLVGAEHHSTGLLWSAVHRLADLGVPVLNLGGGLRPGDQLAEYKQRFGGERRSRLVLKQVYDRSAYAALCREHGRDPTDVDGYFPPYRRP